VGENMWGGIGAWLSHPGIQSLILIHPDFPFIFFNLSESPDIWKETVPHHDRSYPELAEVRT
jgi:hypothetical protein